MSMNYGSRRHRPRVRLLNEETEAEKYKRLGWDPRKTYEENMGYEGVFDRPDDELDWPEVAPQRRKPTRQVRELAAEGRGNDTEIAHVANGEYVIPREFLTPELLNALQRVAAAHGVPLERLIVGNARNRINPNTGAPEFWFDEMTPDMNEFADRIANTKIGITPVGQMSDEGRRNLIQDEGYSAKPYVDIAGNLTSGYGHKGPLVGSAEDALNRDIATADSAVNRNIKIPLTQAEQDALGRLTYNIGSGAFARSSVPGLVNSGDFEGAANQFLQFNKAKNPSTGNLEFNQSLADRRQRERDNFLANTLFVRAPRLP